jgi:hypothetical protein
LKQFPLKQTARCKMLGIHAVSSERLLVCVLSIFVGVTFSWPSIVGAVEVPQNQTQLASTKPVIRLGNGARQLSDQDIANIEMVLPAGKKPWLLSGELGAMLVPSITAYLPPATETREMRRGSLITLRRPVGASVNTQPWTIMDANGAYAQVAVSGRGFDQIEGDQDINRPFSVGGAFDDAELLSIVTFLRLNSSTSGPLRGVNRQADGQIVVGIRRSATGSTRMVLGKQREGLGWIILEVAFTEA